MTARRPPYDFEVLVKSFLRFDKLLRLVRSVRRHYPGVTVRVADDSPDSAAREAACRALEEMGGCEVYRLPPHVGIPVGRNLLVGEVRTPYFVLTDDDKVFTRRTALERLRAVLEADADCVIAAGMNLDYGCLLRYQHGHVERTGRQVVRVLYGDEAPTARIAGIECVPCGLTPCFFMASTALFRQHGVRWDERLKIGEHLWFFCCLPPGLHVYVVPSVRISHFPTRWGDRAYMRVRYDPAELRKLPEVTQLDFSATHIYESGARRFRRRLEGWVRTSIQGALR